MAKLKKFVAYRRLESRPNTRKSKYKGKAYNRSIPPSKIVKYDLGNNKRSDFPYVVVLTSITEGQIRSNALESARQTCTRHMEQNAPMSEYHIQIRAYPHHIMRENPLATGAGADRLSTGMSAAFGVPTGVAVRVPIGKVLVAIFCNKERIEVAKAALQTSVYKIPCSCKIYAFENKKKDTRKKKSEEVENSED
ncbi:MAG: 50S ribosomal protein L16 [Candidatus Woesearchaeota archaeon]|jgi:large subunit ribosomal protein L10e